MAIVIRKKPVCEPAAAALGARIRIRQSLASTRPLGRENASIVYEIINRPTVFFITAAGRAKTTDRSEAVGVDTEEFMHYVVLTSSVPSDQGAVTIVETVTGGTGVPKKAACSLVIL